ncbi:hypothetical protein L7F22_026674 [Adiantum nelumboides]|nr:hypothetical protein [Adiantum nelumboides]
MLAARKSALKSVKSTLNAAQVQLQEKHQSMWKIEGTSSATAVLQGQLTELQSLKDSMEGGACGASSSEVMVIDVKIIALSSALVALGADASNSKIRDDVDRIEKELIDQAASEATCAAQVTFCESLLDQVKRGDSMLLRPTIGEHGSHIQVKVTVPGACATYGLGFVASEVVCVYTLACRDAYHALCFAGWVGSEKECANPSCKRIIPELAKSMRVHNEATNLCGVVAGSSDMPYVATLPPEVPNLKVDPTPDAHTIDTDMHSDDQSTPGGRESSSLASDKILREEGSHVAIDKTPAAEVEPSQQTVGEPQPKEEPMEDVDVKMTHFVAQEGVEAVQRMVQGDADPDSPVFLSDMVKKSRKQKKHVDAGQSKNTRASEMNRSKQQSIKAEEENDGGTSFTHGKAMSEEVPKSPPPMKKTPKKSTPLKNPSIISHPPKPRVCKKL